MRWLVALLLCSTFIGAGLLGIAYSLHCNAVHRLDECRASRDLCSVALDSELEELRMCTAILGLKQYQMTWYAEECKKHCVAQINEDKEEKQ